MARFGVTTQRALITVAAAAWLTACPDLPDFSDLGDAASDADGVDGAETFVPLSLDRVVASVGDPSGGERVTIYGAGFTPGAVVLFNAHRAANPLVLDEDRINVDTPAGAPGLVSVLVTLPDGQSATLTDAYLYRGPLSLEQIAPTSGPRGGGTSVTLRGQGFGPTTRVFIGDRLLRDLDLIDDGTLSGIVPARLLGDAGAVDVVVSDGFEQRILSGAFRYLDPLSLDWLSPSSGDTAGGTEVRLSGRGLSADATVMVGDTVAELVAVGDGLSLTLRTPPGAAGPADLRIVGPLDTLVVPGAFLYLDPDAPATTPRVAHLWPVTGPETGGTRVALTTEGLELGGPVSVRFDALPAAVLARRPSEGLVIVEAPASGGAGPVSVTVEAGGLSASLPAAFTYRRELAVTAVEPPSGAAAGGEEITLKGRGFSDAVEVDFGGLAAEVIRVGVASVTLRSPASVPGRVDLLVRDDEGRQVLIPAGFEYRGAGPATLLALTPGRGARSGGRVVRLHGQGLRRANPALAFGPAAAAEVEVVDDALMIARAPRGDVGRVNVRDPHLGLLAMAYEYFDPSQRFGGTTGGPIPEALNVTVLDQNTGLGVEGAFVILWDDLDTPYQGLTDDRGQLTFSDIAFGPRQQVTAGADNYTTATVSDFDARDVTLRIIPLVSDPQPPGGGGGAPGPTPLPDSRVTGEVSGLDKYIVPPPGDCEARLAVLGFHGSLCDVCEADADCPEEGARCVDLGDQGLRCATACETDEDCPYAYACRAVTGGAVQCLPAPGLPVARCGVTQPDVFSAPEGPTPFALTDAQRAYQLDTRPGEYAVVCLGGYEDRIGGAFTPTRMGVRRHVFAPAGELVAQQNVRLDIPLTRDLRIRLDDAPIGRPETDRHQVDVFIDLGADGVFHMPERGEGTRQNVFTLPHFPARFAESLYDASYTIYASATQDPPPATPTGAGSFTLHTDLTATDDDSVFELDEEGATSTRTGITTDLHALCGDGGARAWAAADEGQVLAFDGTFWGLQQVPSEETLRGIWARSASELWTVGDEGGVFRWGGLRWESVELDLEPAATRWDGVTGVGDALWLWGDRGLWAYDGQELQQVDLGPEAAPPRAVWADEEGSAWIVGDAGLIRRWRAGSVESFDMPGPDLTAVWGLGPDLAWAVGDSGRILRWDGAVWFDLLPVTTRDLHAVHATSSESAWAVGDAGEVLRWDGLRWRSLPGIEHADLRGVWSTAAGRHLAVGLHTLVIGPFLRVPRPGNPNLLGALLDLNLSWVLDPGPEASFTYIWLQHDSGFPFWTIMAEGRRRGVPLPDLKAAWGLRAIWPGDGFFQIARVFIPGFSVDAYDETILTQEAWRSWALAGWGLRVEEPDL